MATVVRYFDLVREMKNVYNYRFRLVGSVKERGIKPTAREVPSGLLFWTFAEKRSAAAGAIFVARDVARKKVSAKMGTWPRRCQCPQPGTGKRTTGCT